MFEIGGIYDFTLLQGYDEQGNPHTDDLWRYRVVTIDGPLLDVEPTQNRPGDKRQIINTHSSMFIKAERQSDELPTLRYSVPAPPKGSSE